jgi:uncharacterized lipoprotein YddW (UPF0748 family)
MRKILLIALVSVFVLINTSCATAQQGFVNVSPAEAKIPDPPREMRAMWVSTVGNGVWPSKGTFNVEAQKKEMIALLDSAQKNHLNCVIFQVRTACDALYPSQIEPWSEYLTGQQGKPPTPMWDPLQTWIDEAHKRGMELHAWFNPYRALHASAKSAVAPNHVSKTHPNIVRKYGNQLWLDPTDQETIRYSLSVFHDVVSRYNVDGIHIDDYFYPYAVAKDPKDKSKGNLDFPDDANWQRYQQSGGKLSRGDWRRACVNTFVEALYKDIKKTRPSAKFGISPFGIWRPQNPPGVVGLDSYEALYCDSKLWLNNGWCDYFSPQLYWPTTSQGQPFGKLIQWWSQQNTQKRILAPGIAIGRNAGDAVKEIELSRQYGNGVVLWHGGNLMRNQKLSADLLAGPYAQPALVPPMPWVETRAPGRPDLKIDRSNGSIEVQINPDRGEKPAQFAIYAHTGGKWEFSVVPADQTRLTIPADKAQAIDQIAVAAVDNCGNISSWNVMKSTTPATPSAASSH